MGIIEIAARTPAGILSANISLFRKLKIDKLANKEPLSASNCSVDAIILVYGDTVRPWIRIP